MAGTGTALNLSGYKLTFDDEFNSFSASPDGSTGTFQTTFYFGGRSLPSNGEQEYYSDSSVGTDPFSLQNGALDITATPGGPAKDISGLITTEQSFSQTYGYFEIRAELPQGQGMWPAFWLLPTDKSWPPELDPLEAFGAPNANGEGGANQVHVGMISTNSSQDGGGWQTVPANIYTGYHTYGVDWEKDFVTYYFDGKEIAQFKTPSDMDKPMYMLANLATGGTWPGAVGSETSQMKIDYIRAYSSTPNARAVALQTVSSPDGTGTGNLDGAVAANGTGTSSSSLAPASTPTPTPVPSGATVGSGPDQIVLHLAEDAYQGNAQFTLAVDGKQIGGAQAVTASHMAGASETFTFDGDFGSGPHDIAVSFTNDLWAGTPATDRNLYVDSIIYDGKAVANSSASLFSNGTTHVTATGSAAPISVPAPAPTPAPTTGDAAHPSPVEARSYIAPDASGVAHGTAGADDIYATGSGQTLIGNGGDDVFNIGTYTATKIMVNGTGVTAISTWASQYTLASGVDDLYLQGNYAHTAQGNGLANYIVASDGNDTIAGGGGDATIQVGTGSDHLTGGGPHDMFVFTKAADHDDVITDFHEGHDTLDLRGLLKDAGYAGTNPVGDHVLQITQHGSDTVISVEPHGSTVLHTVVTLQNVVAASLHSGADYLIH